MTLRNLLSTAALACTLISPALHAAYLEYTISDKTYTVDGIKGVSPFIGSEEPEREYLRSGGAWSFHLEAADSLQDSIPSYEHYQTNLQKRQGDPNAPYLKIHQSRHARTHLDSWPAPQLKGASLIYAWVHDASVKASVVVSATSRNAVTLEVDDAYKSGALRIFAYKDGKLLKPEISKLDALRIAAIEGDIEPLKAARISAKTTKKENRNLLHTAAIAGNQDSIRYLVESAKLDPNSKTKEGGDTPLGLAAKLGRANAVSLLLELGANPNQKNGYAQTPLMLCAEKGHTECFKIIAENGGRFIDNYREMLDFRKDIATLANIQGDNLSNGTYSAALLIAADKGHGDIVSYILNSDEKAKHLTPNRHVARYIVDQLAYQNDLPVALEALLSANPKTGPLPSGRTLLHSFAVYGSSQALDQVYAVEESLEPIDEKGYTPLHLAAMSGNADAINWFAEKGVTLNSPPYTEIPPLWIALESNKPDAALALLKAGATPNQPKPKSQELPIEYLSRNGKFDTASAFLNEGATWPTSSKFVGLVTAKLIRSDQDELLASYHQANPNLFASLVGIQPEILMIYYQSQKCLNLLASIRGTPELAKLPPSLQSTKIEATALQGKSIRYPQKLYDAYGPLSFPVTFVLGNNGKCILPRTPDYIPDDVQNLVEKRVSQFSLRPNEIENYPVLSILEFQIDLPDKLEQALAELNGVDLRSVKSPPRVKKQIPAKYPASLKSKRLTGRVVLEFIVTSKGEVLFPRALSYTHPAFVAPSLEAIKKTAFQPATKDKQPVAVKVRLPINFTP